MDEPGGRSTRGARAFYLSLAKLADEIPSWADPRPQQSSEEEDDDDDQHTADRTMADRTDRDRDKRSESTPDSSPPYGQADVDVDMDTS